MDLRQTLSREAADGSEVIEAMPRPRAGAGGDADGSLADLAAFRRSGAGPEGAAEEAMEAPGLARGRGGRGGRLWRSLAYLNTARGRRALAGHLWRRRGLVVSVAVVAVGVLCVAMAGVFALARSAPSWWVDVDGSDPRNIELADRVQNLSITYIHADHAAGTGGVAQWPVKMTDEAANAWLNIELPGWFAKISDGMDWPESISQVQMVFDSGTVRLGVRVRTEIGTRIYSCAIVPELREDGSLWMKARTVSMGRLTLPAGWVLRGAGSHAAGYIPEQLRGTAEAEALFEKLTGRLPLFERAEVRLSDGRRVRLLDLRVRDGSIITLFETRNPG